MKLPQQGQRIIWMVRLLTSICLAIMLAAAGLAWWTLARIRTERTIAFAEQQQLNSTSARMDQLALQSQSDLLSMLDETSKPADFVQTLNGLKTLIDSEMLTGKVQAVAGLLEKLNKEAASIFALSEKAWIWRTNFLLITEDFRTQKSMDHIRRQIAQLRGAIESYDGRGRLADAVKYRRWLHTSGNEAAELGRQLLVSQAERQTHGTGELRNELAELGRLIELLGGEDRLDQLPDIKENQLAPLLERLRYIASEFGTNDLTGTIWPPGALDSLEIALIGSTLKFSAKRPGENADWGGLLGLRHKLLQLRRDREQLKAQFSGHYMEISKVNSLFTQAAQLHADQLSQKMENSVAANWRRMDIFGIAGALFYGWLAWLVARAVRSQVIELDQARAEAESGRITTQKLMLEQQAAAAQLRESQSLYHSLVEQLPAGVYRKDHDGRYVFANSSFCRMNGIALERIIGKTTLDRGVQTTEPGSSPGENGTGMDPHHAEIMATGRQAEMEECCKGQNGQMQYLHVLKSPVYGSDGAIAGSQGILLDNSARKLAELELERVHKELLKASREAGMAEVATSVLHNVGNVLNSINVAANLLADQARKSRVANVGRLSAMLNEHSHDLCDYITNNPRGRQIPVYLGELAALLSQEQASMLKEIGLLKQNIEHVKEIVAVQQNYAKISGLTEIVKVTDIVEDAVRMNTSSLNRHHVEVVREFDPDPPSISVEKHKVLQILINLIANAKHACEDYNQQNSRIVIRVRKSADRVRIEVSDNGIGIPEENLTKIFNHGFTTKKTGHGFGLHSGALTAKELGGSLRAQSSGSGNGATFVLELPVKNDDTRYESSNR